MRREVLALVAFAVWAGFTLPLVALAESDARSRFERGLALYDAGELAGALAEFEHVQAASPNETVLFNIALVYASLQRPVEATRALDQLLQKPGRLPRARLAEAKRMREAQARRLAQLSITTNVPARIELDGVEVARTPLEAPLVIASGLHRIEASAPGYSPCTRELTIASEVRTDLALELGPDTSVRAQLFIESALLGAEVLVDGRSVGLTPVVEGQQTVARMPLRPTPERQQRDQALAASERQRGFILAGSGLGLTIAGASVAVWAQVTLPPLEHELAQAKLDIQRGSGSACDPALAPPAGMGRRRLRNRCMAGIAARDQDVSDRKLARTLGLVAASAGLVIGGIGVYLLADMTASESPPQGTKTAAGDFETTPWVGFGDAGVSLLVRH